MLTYWGNAGSRRICLANESVFDDSSPGSPDPVKFVDAYPNVLLGNLDARSPIE